MAELTATDVAKFTRGGLEEEDAERLLAAALAAARGICGWHVSPVKVDTVVMDGPGGRILSLPTLNLVSVSEIDDDGEILTATDVRASTIGSVSKRSGAGWSRELGAITATFTHGFTEDEAPDWREAILMTVVAMLAAEGRPDHAMTGKRVDDVEYQWSVTLLQQSPVAMKLLDPYRILLST